MRRRVEGWGMGSSRMGGLWGVAKRVERAGGWLMAGAEVRGGAVRRRVEGWGMGSSRMGGPVECGAREASYCN